MAPLVLNLDRNGDEWWDARHDRLNPEERAAGTQDWSRRFGEDTPLVPAENRCRFPPAVHPIA